MKNEGTCANGPVISEGNKHTIIENNLPAVSSSRVNLIQKQNISFPIITDVTEIHKLIQYRRSIHNRVTNKLFPLIERPP